MRALFLAFILAAGCATTTAPVTTPDEAAVISAALTLPFLHRAYGMNDNPVVLDATGLDGPESWSLAGGEFVDPITAKTIRVEPALIEAMLDANDTPAKLRGVRAPRPLRIVRSGREHGASRVVVVSRPGFSADRKLALVSIERRYDAPCCPDGFGVLVVRDDSGWHAVAIGNYWVV